ncbi:MAG TPA: phosphatase PAP2 family protein [Solirubrobacteraceae bacterium]
MAASSITEEKLTKSKIAKSQATRRDPLWRQALAIAWLCWLYDMLTNLAPTRRAAALAHAHAMVRLERGLDLAPELALNRWLAGEHTLALILSDYYDNAHFVVTLGLLGWLWWRRPDVYVPLRNALVLTNLIAFAVFLLYPVAPPRMLVGEGFTDVVATSHAFGSWHTGSLAADADQYAAMPSLHIAWASWCAYVLWRLSERAAPRWRRLLRTLGVLHVAVTAFAVLATGNHYLLDVLAGFATAALSLCVATGFRTGIRALRNRASEPVSNVTNLSRSAAQGTMPHQVAADPRSRLDGPVAG